MTKEDWRQNERAALSLFLENNNIITESRLVFAYTCRGGESACELGPEGQMASQQEELVERSTAPGGRGRKALHSRS